MATGWSARLRTLARRWTGGRWYPTVVVYFLLFAALGFLIDLPLAYYSDYVRPHAYDLSNQTLGKWLGDGFKGLAVGMAVSAPLRLGPLLAAAQEPAALVALDRGALGAVRRADGAGHADLDRPALQRVQKLWERAKELAGDAADVAKDAAKGALDEAQQLGGAATTKAVELASIAREAAGDVAGKVGDAAAAALAGAKETGEKVADKTADAAAAARDRAAGLIDRAADAVRKSDKA